MLLASLHFLMLSWMCSVHFTLTASRHPCLHPVRVQRSGQPVGYADLDDVWFARGGDLECASPSPASGGPRFSMALAAPSNHKPVTPPLGTLSLFHVVLCYWCSANVLYCRETFPGLVLHELCLALNREWVLSVIRATFLHLWGQPRAVSHFNPPL